MTTEKKPNCGGSETDVCVLVKDTLDQFAFEYCKTCYKTFDSVKIKTLTEKPEKVKKPKRTADERVNAAKIKKEKKEEHLFNHHWYLKDGYPTPGQYTEFGSFSCGGGTTMGFKLAGFNSLGGIEIDPKVAEVYQVNHKPRHFFVQGVKEFTEIIAKEVKTKKKLGVKYNQPSALTDLFNLDVFSGSPPCSSFSMSGDRGEMWGKKKKFREGQTEQVLDTLFFDTIELIGYLQPKTVMLENVKGILAGEAREYVRRINEDFDKVGYYVQHYVLNSGDMGVPQLRERVFFLAIRKDLAENCFNNAQVELFSSYPPINLKFNEPHISFKVATLDFWEDERKPLTPTAAQYYHKVEPGKSFSSVHKDKMLFNWMKLSETKPAPTLACENRDTYFHPTKEGALNDREYLSCGSFPLDFNSLGMDAKWFVGMSVPPIMAAQIATRMKKYWLDVIYQSEYFKGL